VANHTIQTSAPQSYSRCERHVLLGGPNADKNAQIPTENGWFNTDT